MVFYALKSGSVRKAWFSDKNVHFQLCILQNLTNVKLQVVDMPLLHLIK